MKSTGLLHTLEFTRTKTILVAGVLALVNLNETNQFASKAARNFKEKFAVVWSCLFQPQATWSWSVLCKLICHVYMQGGCPGWPSYPGRANFSYISSENQETWSVSWENPLKRWHAWQGNALSWGILSTPTCLSNLSYEGYLFAMWSVCAGLPG